jgi:hypothetical protein
MCGKPLRSIATTLTDKTRIFFWVLTWGLSVNAIMAQDTQVRIPEVVTEAVPIAPDNPAPTPRTDFLFPELPGTIVDFFRYEND